EESRLDSFESLAHKAETTYLSGNAHWNLDRRILEIRHLATDFDVGSEFARPGLLYPITVLVIFVRVSNFKVGVRDGNRIIPIPLAELERAQGADDYVPLWTTSKEYLVSLRLSELEQRLPRSGFLRIHRSHIVNLEYVASIEPYDAARVEVFL